MTTDPLDGLEQLRRIIDEQPEPAPESVMLGLDYCYAEWVAERARHAEEVAALRAQLRRLEGLIGSDAVRRINDLEIQLCTVRDQLDDAHIELTSLRSLLPDVRALARWAIETEHMSDHVNTDQIGDVGRRILAALDSQGIPADVVRAVLNQEVPGG